MKGRCPKCRVLLRVPSRWLGRAVRCPQCQSALTPAAVASGVTANGRADGAVGRSFPMSGSSLEPAPDLSGSDFRGFSGRGRTATPRQQPLVIAVASGFLTLVLLTFGAAWWYSRPSPVVQDTESAATLPAHAAAAAEPQPQPQRSADAPPAPWRRRLLAVSISGYLFANPLLSGSPDKGTAALVKRLANRWHIPDDQTYLVTDTPNPLGAVAPVKPVVEAAITSFLTSSHNTDRVVLGFVGHAVTVDGKAYLVPMDGELARTDTLIPLEWLFARLAECPAREKLLIVDVCRSDPKRAALLPSPGPMSEVLAGALKAPPAGVRVWASCSAGQYSVEGVDEVFNGFEVNGGVFLNQFFQAFLKGGTPGERPDDPLPVDGLAPRVGELTRGFVMGIYRLDQASFLAGAAVPRVDGEKVTDASPARLVMPKPADFVAGGTADIALVRSIFAEVRVPPVRSVANVAVAADEPPEAALAFSAAAVRGCEEVAGADANSPLRNAVRNAVVVMRRHGEGVVMINGQRKPVGVLRDRLKAPVNDKLKTAIEAEQIAGPGVMTEELRATLQTLEQLKDARAAEPSPRWQAHYDLVLAMVKARFAYTNEYNTVLGKIRKDELPPRDPNIHTGWRLWSTEKLSSPRDVRDQADEARALFDRLVKERARTPWEVLARRERLAELGLAWQPAGGKL